MDPLVWSAGSNGNGQGCGRKILTENFRRYSSKGFKVCFYAHYIIWNNLRKKKYRHVQRCANEGYSQKSTMWHFENLKANYYKLESKINYMFLTSFQIQNVIKKLSL